MKLLGVSCFAAMGGPVSNICGNEYAPKAICLARGACVPHAPKNAASFLVRWACKQACREFGWYIFYAYSDSDAGEVGQKRYIRLRIGQTSARVWAVLLGVFTLIGNRLMGAGQSHRMS